MKTLEEMWTDYKEKSREIIEKEGGKFPEELTEKAIRPHFFAGALSILAELAQGPFNDLMEEGSEYAKTYSTMTAEAIKEMVEREKD